MVDLSKYKEAKWNPEFPSQVFVDVTNQCDYRCAHCILGDPPEWYAARKPEFMDIGLYKNVVDEVARNGAVLRICSDGEALIHPNFEGMIAYAYYAKVPVISLTTNGYHLEKLLYVLGELGDGACLDETKFSLEVSLDALYRETYDKIRRLKNGNLQKNAYARVIMNIFSYLKIRRPTMKLIVSAIDQPELPREELAAFRQFWAGLADKTIIRPYVDLKGLKDPKTMKRDPNIERWPCFEPFQRLTVCPDGSIRFCVDDYRRETVIGKLDYDHGIRTETISVIWKSITYKTLREAHLNGNLDGYPCAQCWEWQSKDWNFNYRHALEALFGK